MVQNAAPISMAATCFRRVTCWLRELSWPPIVFHAQFNVVVFTFKAPYGLGPQYLAYCLSLHISIMALKAIYGGGFLQIPALSGAWLGGTE